MKILFFILALFIVSIDSKAQYYMYAANNNPDTFYYPYQNGIQMIEIALAPYMIKSPYNTRGTISEITSLSVYNIYIFRNESGKVINIYNQRDYTIDIKKLRSPEEKVYTEDFLLYQYTAGNYIAPNTKKSTPLFIYQDKDGKLGFMNQAGDIVLKAQYEYFNFHNKNIIIGEIARGSNSLFGIIFPENIDKSIDPIFQYIIKNYSNELYLLGINNSKHIININSRKIIFSALTDYYYNMINYGVIIYYHDSNGNESEIKLHSRKPNKAAFPNLRNHIRYLELHPPYSE